ncbi:lanthionine synthetase LanC family protein [Chitinophaga sp. 22321]|uniref:Lanthionine synthetase C-like protein n=1 Tax=Chitinophaga hostae TaxID=2831022 RepID=A0ABS5ISK2_9BACT|nr:lanthionine synthetase LanC family protein [Chitinophaga hostae]MBS0025731.1 hypothetical protein [Chitinophaga hostae]
MKDRIADILNTAREFILDCDPEKIQLENILNGKLGLALYAVYMSREEPDSPYLMKVATVLESIFNEISEGTSDLTAQSSFADGLPGLGYVLHLVMKEKILGEEYQEQLAVINELAYGNALKMLDAQSFDYFYGAIGLLFYLHATESYQYCEEIITKVHSYGVANNFFFYNNTDDSYTMGINFGFAHGSGAIIAVMLSLYESGIEREKTRDIILNTLEQLLQFRRSEIDVERIKVLDTRENCFPSIFPYNIMTERPDLLITPEDGNSTNLYHYSGRVGWCNSDLGMVYLLYKTGTDLSVEKYIHIAEEMCAATMMRKNFAETDIRDYYICHGTSGVAMLYKKIYDITNNPIHQQSYHFWINATTDYMEKEMKILSFSPDKLNLLTGWLGALLVLYGYKESKELKGWDKIFLV